MASVAAQEALLLGFERLALVFGRRLRFALRRSVGWSCLSAKSLDGCTDCRVCTAADTGRCQGYRQGL